MEKEATKASATKEADSTESINLLNIQFRSALNPTNPKPRLEQVPTCMLKCWHSWPVLVERLWFDLKLRLCWTSEHPNMGLANCHMWNSDLETDSTVRWNWWNRHPSPIWTVATQDQTPNPKPANSVSKAISKYSKQQPQLTQQLQQQMHRSTNMTTAALDI